MFMALKSDSNPGNRHSGRQMLNFTYNSLEIKQFLKAGSAEETWIKKRSLQANEVIKNTPPSQWSQPLFGTWV